ncbi:MAG: signal peptidase II [Acidobacteria bacterium]|nr:signal peptidase II [Acidobacteriota bacterium]
MASSQPIARSFYLLVAAALFLLDQGVKWLVAGSLRVGEVRPVLPGFFNLTYLHNRGAAFGLFADSDSPAVRALLIGFSLAALALVLYLLWRGVSSRPTGWGLGLILGGALGNLLDRVRAGQVVDFLDFHFGGYHWPAFNLADSAVVLGALLLMVEVLRPHREPAAAASGVAHEA